MQMVVILMCICDIRVTPLVIKIFGITERCCRWPSQLCTFMVHLIPKDTGGRRPIGNIASSIRIWAKCRREEVRAWKKLQDGDYDWMGPGRGSERAVWAQSVHEEALRQRRMHSAAIMVDLTKAYERVPLARIWRRGMECGFQPRILALGLEVCAFARRLVYRGAVSKPAHTLTALLAGLGLASDFLYLFLSEPIEVILQRHSSLHVCMVADDIKMMVEGTEEQPIARKLERATDDLIQMLEEGMGAKVSRDEGGKRGKTVALASSSRMEKAMATRMRKRRIGMQKKVRSLGVGFAAGGVRRKVKTRRTSKESVKRSKDNSGQQGLAQRSRRVS